MERYSTSNQAVRCPPAPFLTQIRPHGSTVWSPLTAQASFRRPHAILVATSRHLNRESRAWAYRTKVLSREGQVPTLSGIVRILEAILIDNSQGDSRFIKVIDRESPSESTSESPQNRPRIATLTAPLRKNMQHAPSNSESEAPIFGKTRTLDAPVHTPPAVVIVWRQRNPASGEKTTGLPPFRIYEHLSAVVKAAKC
ncbi:hypothetical protein C8J57DRAFT_1228985 [Mycena rebaudengoi]|nr:hypothetical protein C8J57DRAFT_1228985 [Mycena rebaudengoi]